LSECDGGLLASIPHGVLLAISLSDTSASLYFQSHIFNFTGLRFKS
jgi:hypothetical protein